MDNAVALVQAYLRINGYFSVAEFPILEDSHGQFYDAHAQYNQMESDPDNMGIMIAYLPATETPESALRLAPARSRREAGGNRQ